MIYDTNEKKSYYTLFSTSDNITIININCNKLINLTGITFII